MTALCQVKACLNSLPLTPTPNNDDGLEALTPSHFLIGRPLEAIPDPAFSYRFVSLLPSLVFVSEFSLTLLEEMVYGVRHSTAPVEVAPSFEEY